MLKISNLTVKVESKAIVNNISLSVKQGEIHILMGPNGSGKTTLALALMGSPKFKLKSPSQISVNGVDITNFPPDQRARVGLFLSFQNPPAIEGVSTHQLLSSIGRSNLIDQISKILNLKSEIFNRPLGTGLSGGEKKKLEVLQMLALRPKYAILDEIDSGLDIDSLKTVFRLLNNVIMQQFNHKPGVLLITHNPRIFKYLIPDFIHIMKSGKIIKSGGKELVGILEKDGYAKIK